MNYVMLVTIAHPDSQMKLRVLHEGTRSLGEMHDDGGKRGKL